MFGFVSVNNFCVLINAVCLFLPSKNLYVDDGKIQEKVKVQVDVIVQDHARKIPKWITVTYFSYSVLSY